MGFDLKKLLQDGINGVGGAINNVGMGIKELTGNNPDYQPKPTVVYEQQKGQPYGGYYNPRRNLIDIVRTPNEDWNNSVMTHEMAHSDFQKGRNAFKPLQSDNMFEPINPDFRIQHDLNINDPKLYNYVGNLMKTNIAYKNGYDLPQELYANRAEKNRYLAQMLTNRYMEND